MIGKKWCTVAVFTFCSLALLSAPSIAAQHGPERRPPPSRAQQDPRQHSGPAYNATTESTFTGIVGNVFPMAVEGIVPQGKADQPWTGREAAGLPLQSTAGIESRGFWTKKRVLLAALVVKAAVVAILLLK